MTAEIRFDDLLQTPVGCVKDLVTATDLEEMTGYTRQAFHWARKANKLWAHRFGREWVFYKPYAMEYIRRMKVLGDKKYGIRD
jgi:hypothetical protein